MHLTINRTKSPGRQSIPTPRELSIQANAISAEGYKWEKYRWHIYFIISINFLFVKFQIKLQINVCRCLLDIAMKDLEKQRLEYDKSPENHPLYPEEWRIFWSRRYKELQAGLEFRKQFHFPGTSFFSF